MTDNSIRPGRAQWLWYLLFAAFALLIALWLFESWTVDSNVDPGPGPGGIIATGAPIPVGDQSAAAAAAAPAAAN